MIGLSAQYAVRAMVHIAGTPGMHTADSIASHTGIPRGYLAKLMGRLHQARLVSTQRGLGGGYALLREADAVTVLDVVRAVQPRDDLSRCHACRAEACRIVGYMSWFADTCEEILAQTRLSAFITDCASAVPRASACHAPPPPSAADGDALARGNPT